MTTPLDETSQAIIAELRQDGRRPYATIGKAVGMPETAVRQRVQHLVETGVVQIAAVTDPIRLGMTRQAMIGSRRRATCGSSRTPLPPSPRSRTWSSRPARSTCSPR